MRLIGGGAHSQDTPSSGYFSGLAAGGISLFKATGDKHALVSRWLLRLGSHKGGRRLLQSDGLKDGRENIFAHTITLIALERIFEAHREFWELNFRVK